MSGETLEVIKDAMQSLGLTYAFMEMECDGEPEYPYFVGEYQEQEPDSEDGEESSSFILDGFSRNGYTVLEKAKEIIKKYFPPSNGRLVTTKTGSVAAVFYAGSTPVPTGDAELKKIQINLTIKEWRVRT